MATTSLGLISDMICLAISFLSFLEMDVHSFCARERFGKLIRIVKSTEIEDLYIISTDLI